MMWTGFHFCKNTWKVLFPLQWENKNKIWKPCKVPQNGIVSLQSALVKNHRTAGTLEDKVATAALSQLPGTTHVFHYVYFMYARIHTDRQSRAAVLRDNNQRFRNWGPWAPTIDLKPVCHFLPLTASQLSFPSHSLFSGGAGVSLQRLVEELLGSFKLCCWEATLYRLRKIDSGLPQSLGGLLIQEFCSCLMVSSSSPRTKEMGLKSL